MSAVIVPFSNNSYAELRRIYDDALKRYNTLETDVKRWAAQKSTAEKKIRDLTAELDQRKRDQQMILLERLRDIEHAEVYADMLRQCEADIASLTAKIQSVRNIESTIRKRKSELRSSVDLIKEILSSGAVSDTQLRMLIDKIIIREHDCKLDITVIMRADFRHHIDFFDENGELTDVALDFGSCPLTGEEDC